MTTVGIVVPAYQAASTIERALRSLCSQTFEDWRAVVVDDGSTDDTAEKARSLGDTRILVVSHANSGPAASRNTALRELDTAHIGFLDADDEWLPDKLAQQVPRLQHADLVYADCDVVHPGGTSRPYSARVPPMPSDADALAWLLSRPNPIPILTVLVRASHLAAVGGFQVRYRGPEDLALWLSLARRGARFDRVPAVVARYHLGANSVSADPLPMLEAEAQLFEDQTQELAGTRYQTLARRRALKTKALGRQASRSVASPMAERWRDLAVVLHGRLDPRAVASQIAYTLLPGAGASGAARDRRA